MKSYFRRWRAIKQMVHVLAAVPFMLFPPALHPLTHWLGLILETILEQAKHSVRHDLLLLSRKAISSKSKASKSAVFSLFSNACKSNAPGAGITTSMMRANTHKKMSDFCRWEIEETRTELYIRISFSQ